LNVDIVCRCIVKQNRQTTMTGEISQSSKPAILPSVVIKAAETLGNKPMRMSRMLIDILWSKIFVKKLFM